MAVKPSCDDCRATKKLFGRTPPCEKCLPPVLPGNREAFAVWEYCSGQVITAGMGEVLDISFPAVRIAIEELGMRDSRELFLSVVEIARAYYGAIRRKQQQGAGNAR